MPTTLSKPVPDLPDLPLLEVFANLPLTDLLAHIPLVCSNWHRLQREALRRRNRLYLVPESPTNQFGRHWIQHLAVEDVLGGGPSNRGSRQVVEVCDPDLHWCSIGASSTLNPAAASAISSSGERGHGHQHLLNTLPLDGRLLCRADCGAALGPLSTPSTVARLVGLLPKLTELTVAFSVHHSSERILRETAERLLDNLTALVRKVGPASPGLTTFRLYLRGYPREDCLPRPRTTEEMALDRLVTALNDRSCLPLLRSLQLRLDMVPEFEEEQLVFEDSVLQQLPLLMLNSGQGEDSLLDRLLDREFNRDQVFKQVILYRPIFTEPLSKEEEHYSSYVRLLSMRIKLPRGGYVHTPAQTLERTCARLPGLACLRVCLFDWSDIRSDGAGQEQSLLLLLARLLPPLAALPALTHLHLDYVTLVPHQAGEADTDTDTEFDPLPAGQFPSFVLPRLRHLTLYPFELREHDQVLEGLQPLVRHCLPALEQLNFDLETCERCSRGGVDEAAACRRTMLLYLATCPSLRTVRFEHAFEHAMNCFGTPPPKYCFTRASETEAFQPVSEV